VCFLFGGIPRNILCLVEILVKGHFDESIEGPDKQVLKAPVATGAFLFSYPPEDALLSYAFLSKSLFLSKHLPLQKLIRFKKFSLRLRMSSRQEAFNPRT